MRSLDRESLAALLARPALRRTFDALADDGEETRVVGGAVRDALLGGGGALAPTIPVFKRR